MNCGTDCLIRPWKLDGLGNPSYEKLSELFQRGV